MQITVPNWFKYQERADRGNYLWFKFWRSTWRDKAVFALQPLDKLLWIYILSCCNESNSDTFDFNAVICAAETGLKDPEKRLSFLLNTGLITSPEFPGKARQEKEEEKEKNTVIFDLESIYQAYPRKLGKGEGMKFLQRDIKTPEDYAKLVTALRNYRDEVADRPEQYVKHFPRWCRVWREYAAISPRQQTFLPTGVDDSNPDARGPGQPLFPEAE